MKNLMTMLLLLIVAAASAQIVNIPDANFKTALIEAGTPSTIYTHVAKNSSGESIIIDVNNDNEIQVTEALAVYYLNLQNFQQPMVINSLVGVQAFTNIRELSCPGIQLAILPLAGLINLKELRCYNNNITSLDFTGLVNLEYLDFKKNNVSAVDFSPLVKLKKLDCGDANLSGLNLAGLTHLESVNCHKTFGFSNPSGSVNVTGCTSLEEINIGNSGFTSLILGNNPVLETIDFRSNFLTFLDTAGAPAIKYLDIGFNNITTINLSICTALETFDISANELLSSLVLGSKPVLNYLNCAGNALTSLDLSGCTTLQGLIAGGSAFVNLDLSSYPSLTHIDLEGTETLQNLELGAKPYLGVLKCSYCALEQIDLSGCTMLESAELNFIPQLKYLNLKNGSGFLIPDIQLNQDTSPPPMLYMCIDEGEESDYNYIFEFYDYININSYCSFMPGSNYNTITGTTIFDIDNNGCGTGDTPRELMKVKINDGTTTGYNFTNNLSQYKFYTQAGSFTLTPEFENSWFTASPASAVVNFANNNNNTSTQNFCVTSNGIHPDVEVVVAPISDAQPGFDAYYTIVYKNKGNQMLSGAVTFTYNDAVLDFVSATPGASTASTGQLTFNYTGLLPFEHREVIVRLNLNGPMEIPSLNINDVLPFSVSITPLTGDETPADNSFNLNQVIVGSYDPNDIACLEGAVAPTSSIGGYLHYVVNFENTGTAPAHFVVVKHLINPAQFDISSLQMLSSSHNVVTRVTGNKVEFIFDNIMLPALHHGNILFKIKSNSLLNPGALVSNQADIFFDYNFPIETNDANTTFQTLNAGNFANDDSVSVYPNPSNGIVNIKASTAVNAAQLYDVQGRLLQSSVINAAEGTINIAERAAGIYFLKVSTDNGMKVEKIVKQ